MALVRRARSAAAALLALGVVTSPPGLGAQTTSASVSGLVRDALGGTLGGASVTLTSRTQRNALATTTDAEGRFVFPIVRPDTYALRVSLRSFKTLERTNVAVSANDRFFTGALTLELGVMEESLSVSGRVSELAATASASTT